MATNKKGKGENGPVGIVRKIIGGITFLIDILPLVIYSIIYIYNISNGKFIQLNSILLSVTAAYAIFCIIVHKKKSKGLKTGKKFSKSAYAITKAVLDMAINVANIAAMFYTLNEALADAGRLAAVAYSLATAVAIIFSVLKLVMLFERVIRNTVNLLISIFVHGVTKKVSKTLGKAKNKGDDTKRKPRRKSLTGGKDSTAGELPHPETEE